MKQARTNRFCLRRRTLAGLVALAASSMAGAAGQTGSVATPDKGANLNAATLDAATAAACGCVYSVINLDPEGGAFPLLNERGQAAVGSFVFGTQRFFDGERLYDLGSLGGGYTLARGLNNRGVVVGETDDDTGPFGTLRAFTWTVARGMRALPGAPGAIAYDINDRNQVVGLMPVPEVSRRAVRWDPDGRIVFLGPLPLSGSEAYAINNHALAGGFMDIIPAGQIHATVWNPAGALTDLGTLGGDRAFSLFVNEKGEVAGYSDNATNDTEQGFSWNRRDGLVPTGAQGGGSRLVAGQNDRGETVGDTDIPGGSGAYLWSRSLGLRLLPRGPGVETDAFDVNNRTQIVGGIRLASGEQRAVRWDGLAAPLDLNTRLYRPPAGLVLQAGAAINDAGDILAYSNAGLVLLRPGTRGTAAPVLGPVRNLPASASVGQDVNLALGFTDNAPTQTHTASVEWNDGCASPYPLVSESGGVGEVRFQHHFCSAGYYFLTVRVTDSGGRTTEVRRDIVVNAPGLSALSGTGTLGRSAGVAAAKGQFVRFALWAPLGAASKSATSAASAAAAAAASGAGKPYFGLSGPFQFRSEQIGAPSVSGQLVRLAGTGRYNGQPGYRFQLESQGKERLHVRISHSDANGKEVVDYDNGAGAGAGAAAKSAAPAPAAERTLVAEGGLTLSS